MSAPQGLPAVLQLNQPTHTTQGHGHAHYPTALEYLRDVIELPQFYKDLLHNNEHELSRVVHVDIQLARPVRDLVWAPNMVLASPAIAEHFTANKVRLTARCERPGSGSETHRTSD